MNLMNPMNPCTLTPNLMIFIPVNHRDGRLLWDM